MTRVNEVGNNFSANSYDYEGSVCRAATPSPNGETAPYYPIISPASIPATEISFALSMPPVSLALALAFKILKQIGGSPLLGCGFPDEGFRHFELGLKLFNEKYYEEALDEFRQVVENFPGASYAAESQMMIGACYYELENYKQAIYEFQIALQTYPEIADQAEQMITKSYEAIGDRLFDQGGYGQAIANYETALMWERFIPQLMFEPFDGYRIPLRGDIKFKIGLCYFKIAEIKQNELNYREALDAYEQAVSFFQAIADEHLTISSNTIIKKRLYYWGKAYENMGDINLIWGRYYEADELYAQAVKKYELLAPPNCLRGNRHCLAEEEADLYLKWGDLRFKMAEEYEQAHPNNPSRSKDFYNEAAEKYKTVWETFTAYNETRMTSGIKQGVCYSNLGRLLDTPPYSEALYRHGEASQLFDEVKGVFYETNPLIDEEFRQNRNHEYLLSLTYLNLGISYGNEADTNIKIYEYQVQEYGSAPSQYFTEARHKYSLAIRTLEELIANYPHEETINEARAKLEEYQRKLEELQ